MNYLRAQVNFRQLRAETAVNRYLRRFLPASAGIFTCGSVYLRPSQVILHAPVLQCRIKVLKIHQESQLKLFSVSWELLSLEKLVVNLDAADRLLFSATFIIWKKNHPLNACVFLTSIWNFMIHEIF